MGGSSTPFSTVFNYYFQIISEWRDIVSFSPVVNRNSLPRAVAYILFSVQFILIYTLMMPLAVKLLTRFHDYLLPSTPNLGCFIAFWKFSLYIIVLIFTIFAMYEYALFFYPNIPHSLGGAKPRCAYLDVDISKTSVDSRSALFGADGDTSTTRRSDALDVYYAGDNWVLSSQPKVT